MTDHGQISASRAAQLSARFEEAINNLSLGSSYSTRSTKSFLQHRYRKYTGCRLKR